MSVCRSVAGIHIETALRPDQEIQPLAVAKLFKKLAEKEQPGLVILGKQSIDGDNAQTAPMLAALLDWPQATFAAKVEPVDGNKVGRCARPAPPLRCRRGRLCERKKQAAGPRSCS